MKNVLDAPFMTEMRETAANMYAHGWDERNGGNISLLLDDLEAEKYLDTEKFQESFPPALPPPNLTEESFWSQGRENTLKTLNPTRRETSA